MILETVQIPTVYSSASEGSETEQGFRCSAVVAALRDAIPNGVLLVDAEGSMESTILSGLSGWPIKHRQRAQELLLKLRKRNRIVAVACSPDLACSNEGCQRAVAIVSRTKPNATITPIRCTCRQECLPDPIPSIPIDEYVASSFATRCRSAQSIALADGQLTKGQFATDVLEPVFRHAKHIRLFDRIIGSQLTNQLREQRLSTRTSTAPVLRRAFESSLTWMFDLFVTCSRGQTGRTFEICSAVDGQVLSEGELAIAADALREAGRRMQQRETLPLPSGVEFTMTVKVESASAKMRHARFLYTDQVHLLVERGFDLLRGDDRVRDVVLSVDVPDAPAIESEFRRLRDAPTGA